MIRVELSNLLSIICYSTRSFTLSVSVTLLMPDGCYVKLQDRFVTQSDGSDSSISFALPTSTLISVVVSAATGNPMQGECFIVASLIHSNIGVILYKDVLFSSYYVGPVPLSFPGTSAHNPLDQPGRIRLYTPADPSAGANVSVPVPTGFTWRILAFGYLLTCSAGVANRYPFYSFSDGTTVFYAGLPGPVVVALGAQQMYFIKDASESRALNSVSNMPLLLFPQAFVIASSVTALQAADQISNTTLLVEEWATA